METQQAKSLQKNLILKVNQNDKVKLIPTDIRISIVILVLNKLELAK